MKNKRILVTTTSTISNYAVHKYLGPIYANVVLGSNIFSDMSASITDFFGGKSISYQNKLNQIFEDAMNQCIENAISIGANAILAYKVDISEISGGGKQMFMILASGTAVIAEDQRDLSIEKNEQKLIPFDKIKDFEQRNEVIEKYGNGTKIESEEVWKLVKYYKVHEIFHSQFKHIGFYDSDHLTSFQKSFIEYVAALSESSQKEILYNILNNTSDNNDALFISKLIISNRLFDFDKIKDILNKDSFVLRKRGIEICLSDKKYYEFDDISNYEELSKLLEENFPVIHKSIRGKSGLLSSKEIDMWECKCGKKRNATEEYCETTNCNENAYGFKANEIKPQKVKLFIDKRKDILKSLLLKLKN